MSKTKVFRFNVKNLKYSLDDWRFFFNSNQTTHSFVTADFDAATVIIDGAVIFADGVLVDVSWTLVRAVGTTVFSLTKAPDSFAIVTDGGTKTITLTSIVYAYISKKDPQDLAYAHAINLEADYNEQKLYGDGALLSVLADDKGKTGTISVTDIETGYEIDCGRMRVLANGYADIQQRSTLPHAIYYEIEALDNGVVVTIKNWLLGCLTGKASESYQQTEDDPTFNKYEFPLSVLGENLKTATGSADYTDANGETTKVYRITSFPDDDDYLTFGDIVPLALHL